MANPHNIILKAISLGFLLHFLQLSIKLNSGGFVPFNLFFLIYGGASLITAVLLWISPRVGIIIALIRSLIGIFWAIFIGDFLNVGRLSGPDAFNVWPSAFFFISIILLLYIGRTGAIFQENSTKRNDRASIWKRLPILVLISLALLSIAGMIYYMITYLSLILGSKS